jgi:DNA ligase-1
MTQFKPMLASKVKPEKLSYPLIVQVKLDGIRASVVDGQLVSRTLKLIPNREIQEALGRPEFNGLDGELIVGAPEAPGCMQATTSFVMSGSKTGADWTYYVFDKWDVEGGYAARIDAAMDTVSEYADEVSMTVLHALEVPSESELNAFEVEVVEDGHEGVIVRKPDARYKFGRASVTAGELGKIKRFDDSEAVIIGVYEEMHNGNEKVTNALGRSERSSHQENKTGKGTLGGFEVRDLVTGIEFRVGTGFDAAQRAEFWENQADLIGCTLKYKSFSVGVKEKPRHPVFLGFRDMEIDG